MSAEPLQFPEPFSDTGSRGSRDPKVMTFVQHLEELRRRLIFCLLAVAAGSIVGWWQAGRIIGLIDAPLRSQLGDHGRLVVTTVYGGFTLQLKVALVVGFALALPVTVSQLWAFVAPAFGAGANRWAPIWMTSAIALFVAGATTGFFTIPLAVSFFAHFQGPNLQLLPLATEYIGFVTLILLVFGVSFELPLVLVTLSAAGITSSRWLASKRLIAFFACFVFATVATPGADWVSPLILGGILYVLFELGVLISRLIGK
jgi:sec-independent protein translocase protein TatC